jgi:hypothetical protein
MIIFIDVCRPFSFGTRLLLLQNMLNHGPIIIVDDDPNDLALIKEICRMQGIPNKLSALQ